MNDLEFLKELKENVVSGQLDITKHEMAIKMLDDWINELENTKEQAIQAREVEKKDEL